jgi:heme/copper-type cytochrome/quinol oxidase subunit 2
MLFIFGLAALSLLAGFAIVFVVPIMIVVTVVRSRRRKWDDTSASAVDSDSVFVELVAREWPGETVLLTRSDTPHQ